MNEEVNMKERVVGGLVLSLLALVLIVLILSGQDEPLTQSRSSHMVQPIHLPQQRTAPEHQKYAQQRPHTVAPQSVLDMVQHSKPRVKIVKVKPRPRRVKNPRLKPR